MATRSHPDLAALLARVEEMAAGLGIEVAFDRELEPVVGSGRAALTGRLEGVECLLTLGGDGTLLRGARLAAPRGVPLLGCNLGHLGFLTSAPLEQLDEALGRLAAGELVEDRRLALDVRVVRDGAPSTFYALNDAVVHKSGFARLMTMRVWVDDQEVGQYSADGIVVSTATGSTAYSLSAGGPILVPGLDALVATPICPHTLAVRPLVVPAAAAVTVEVLTRGDGIVLTLDGQVGTPLGSGDRVRAARSPHPVRLLRFPGQSFFAVLRQKLRWGDVRPSGQ